MSTPPSPSPVPTYLNGLPRHFTTSSRIISASLWQVHLLGLQPSWSTPCSKMWSWRSLGSPFPISTVTHLGAPEDVMLALKRNSGQSSSAASLCRWGDRPGEGGNSQQVSGEASSLGTSGWGLCLANLDWNNTEVGAMAQQLRAVAVCAEDLVSVPDNHMAAHNSL